MIHPDAEESSSPTASTESQSPSCCSCGIFSADTEPDGNFVFHWYDFVLVLVGLVLFYVDITTDILLAEQFFGERQWVYGSVTAGLVSLSYIFSSVLYVFMVFQTTTKVGAGTAFCAVFLFVAGPALGPLFIAGLHLFYGCRSRSKGITALRRKGYVKNMKNGLLMNMYFRLLEVYLESAPQLVWQLYILLVTKPRLHDTFRGWLRILGLLSSWASLATVQATASKVGRHSTLGKKPTTLRMVAADVLWRFVQTGGRVPCTALRSSLPCMTGGFWPFCYPTWCSCLPGSLKRPRMNFCLAGCTTPCSTPFSPSSATLAYSCPFARPGTGTSSSTSCSSRRTCSCFSCGTCTVRTEEPGSTRGASSAACCPPLCTSPFSCCTTGAVTPTRTSLTASPVTATRGNENSCSETGRRWYILINELCACLDIAAYEKRHRVVFGQKVHAKDTMW